MHPNSLEKFKNRALLARAGWSSAGPLPNVSTSPIHHNPLRSQRRPRSQRITPWGPARTAWLLFTPEADRDADDQLALARIKQVDADVAQAHHFVHTFQQIVRDQQPAPLTA